MRTNDKFLSTFLAVALGLVFFSVFPALSSRDDDEEDTVHKFEIAMSGRTGLSYKFLEELLDDDDSYGASVIGGKRKSLKITDPTKFKKAFRDLHLSFLKSFDDDTDVIESCTHLERFDKYKDFAMRQIRINGYYLFNITSERAIVKACGKGTLKMLNETVDALRFYAAEKLNPKLIKTLQAFAKLDDEDESQSEDEGASRSEEGGGDNGEGQSKDSMQDEELKGRQSAVDEEGAELTGVVRDMLTSIHSHKAQMEDKTAQIKSLEDDIEAQKGAIAALQPFQTIVSFLLKENEIDDELFNSAMEERKIEDIKSLLSPKFTGTSLGDLLEELENGFEMDEDQGEEGGSHNGDANSD